MLKTYSTSLDYVLLGLMAQKAGKSKTAAGYFVKAAEEGDLDETLEALDEANQEMSDDMTDPAPDMDQGIDMDDENALAQALVAASRRRVSKSNAPSLTDMVNDNSDSMDLRTTDAVDGNEVPAVEEVAARVAKAKRNALALKRK